MPFAARQRGEVHLDTVAIVDYQPNGGRLGLGSLHRGGGLRREQQRGQRDEPEVAE